MERIEFEINGLREINKRINQFFKNIKALQNPDLKFGQNDEFIFLNGKFKFVRTLSLAKRIGMVDVFYWKEEKRAYEMIEKFNLYFYENASCQLTNYEAGGGYEKGGLRQINLSDVHNSYFQHFYQMLVDREILLNLSADDPI